MSSSNDPPPPILRLPPELRLKIYRLLLLAEQTVRMKWILNNPCPNDLFPTVLRTCRLIHHEAMDVLYGENLFRAHRLDKSNQNAASIRRAKFVIGQDGPEGAELDAAWLPEFLETHPKLEHLVLQFGYRLLEDSKLRDEIGQSLFTSCYSSRLTIHSAIESTRSRYNAARLRETVDSMASIKLDNPKHFRRVVDMLRSLHAQDIGETGV